MIRTALVTMSLAAVLIPGPASAMDGDSIGFRLQAYVEPFCRIQSELGDAPATVVDGVVELGAVRQVCNTHGGYNINVQLLNVSSGALHHGEAVNPLNSDGRTQISSPMARSRTDYWRLTDAHVISETAPIYLRVSISPL